MKIGYARVSTDDQNLALQLDALRQAGCERVFTDQGVSGAAIERDGLSQALASVGGGDTLVVWKMDRLGRSLSFLIGPSSRRSSRFMKRFYAGEGQEFIEYAMLNERGLSALIVKH